MDIVEEGRQWLQRLAAQQTLECVAGALAVRDLSAVVLKGAWLLTEVYGPSDLRPITDVDLLVGGQQFDPACAALKQGGFVCCGGDVRQRVFRHPELSLGVDLHRALFPPGCFELDSNGFISRSRPCQVPPLRWPEPMDGFAHLIGHFALHRGLPRNLERRHDFERLGRRFSLDPQLVATHLMNCGLSRATRYVLDMLAQSKVDVSDMVFCDRVRRALRSDPVGEVVARGCRWALPRVPPGQPWGAVLSCLLEPSLGQAALSAVRRPLVAAMFRHGER